MNRSLGKILSYIEVISPSSLIYSALSAYGRRRGGELPGKWFVSAFAPLGKKPAAVRQALYRLERAGELVVRRSGRMNHYSLSSLGQTAVDIGRTKITSPPERDWDGLWTLVAYQFSAAERDLRRRARAILDLEGFAQLVPGLYLHPRDRVERLLRAFEPARIPVTVFRGSRFDSKADEALAASLWDLDQINRSFSGFVGDFGPLLTPPIVNDGATAFALRFVLVMRFLAIAWRNPELPPSLLPDHWQGDEAQRIASTLYERLLPGTLAYGDALTASLITKE